MSKMCSSSTNELSFYLLRLRVINYFSNIDFKIKVSNRADHIIKLGLWISEKTGLPDFQTNKKRIGSWNWENPQNIYFIFRRDFSLIKLFHISIKKIHSWFQSVCGVDCLCVCECGVRVCSNEIPAVTSISRDLQTKSVWLARRRDRKMREPLELLFIIVGDIWAHSPFREPLLTNIKQKRESGSCV